MAATVPFGPALSRWMPGRVLRDGDHRGGPAAAVAVEASGGRSAYGTTIGRAQDELRGSQTSTEG